jgi:hypothetical protein
MSRREGKVVASEPSPSKISLRERQFENLLRRTADVPKITVKRTSKWGSLGERVAKLKDGESIVIEPEGDVAEEVRKIRSGLNCIRACRTVRHSVKIVDGKIVISRLENWPNLSAFRFR